MVDSGGNQEEQEGIFEVFFRRIYTGCIVKRKYFECYSNASREKVGLVKGLGHVRSPTT